MGWFPYSIPFTLQLDFRNLFPTFFSLFFFFGNYYLFGFCFAQHYFNARYPLKQNIGDYKFSLLQCCAK